MVDGWLLVRRELYDSGSGGESVGRFYRIGIGFIELN